MRLKKDKRFTALLLFPSLYHFLLATSVQASTADNSDLDNYLRVIWGLAVVLGIILIIYGIVKKRFSLLSSSSKQEINILEIKPLMGKKALCLVNVRGKDFLLGISSDNISNLASFAEDSDETFAEVLKASTAKSQP